MIRRLPILLVSALAVTAVADGTWSTYDTRAGAVFEKRPVASSSFEELRASFEVPQPPEAVVDAIWSVVVEGKSTTVKRRDVLRRTASELVIYEQIAAPVVSDRDVVLRLTRTPRAADGSFEVRFETARDLGPPPDPHFTRLTVVRGTWTVSPLAEGKSRLVYTCYSEPGGSIPAAFVRGAQRDQAILDVENVRRKLNSK